MPPAAVYVGRPSRWGNPWRVTEEMPAEEAVARYRAWLDGLSPMQRRAFLDPLRGRDLACWCAPGKTCHAEVLLAMANETEP
jgi:hypothetical protein